MSDWNSVDCREQVELSRSDSEASKLIVAYGRDHLREQARIRTLSPIAALKADLFVPTSQGKSTSALIVKPSVSSFLLQNIEAEAARADARYQCWTHTTRGSAAEHVLKAEYFKSINALNYTMMHDDGQQVKGWANVERT